MGKYKIALLAGLGTVAIVGIGALVWFKFFGDKAIEPEKKKKRKGPKPPIDAAKEEKFTDFISLLEEEIVSMQEIFERLSADQAQVKKEVRDGNRKDMTDRLNNALIEVEKKMCMRRNISWDDFQQELTAKKDAEDQDVMLRVRILSEQVQNALSGQKIILNLPFEKKLEMTPETAFAIYERLVFSQWYYNAELVKQEMQRKSPQSEDIDKLLEGAEVEHIKRSYTITSLYKIPLRSAENPKIAILKIFYYFKAANVKFAEDVNKLNGFNCIADLYIKAGKKIESFSRDPIDLPEKDFVKYCLDVKKELGAVFGSGDGSEEDRGRKDSRAEEEKKVVPEKVRVESAISEVVPASSSDMSSSGAGSFEKVNKEKSISSDSKSIGSEAIGSSINSEKH